MIMANDMEVNSATVLKNVRNIQGLAKLASRKSIMTMAAPGMFQYPVVMSNAIEVDAQMSIVKAYQLTFAGSVCTAFSLNPIMDRGKTPQLSEFVQTFHQNDPNLLGGNVTGAAQALGVSIEQSTENIDPENISVESATVATMNMNDSLAMNLALKGVESSLCMESLNDMYTPYDRTERIIRERLDTIKEVKAKKALEGDLFDKVDAKGNITEGGLGQLNRAVNGAANANAATGIRKAGKDGKPGDLTITNAKYAVEKNAQLEALEPTMVNVQVVAHGGKDANGSDLPSVHNLTLGVKAMPRVIDTNLMVASMVEASQESRAIFKFLKWTKGEQSTLDYVLGFSASKKKALQKNAKAEVKFLEQSKKRKRINGIGKFLNNEVLPTVSIVITAYEASKIKEICGIDLNNYSDAVKLMNQYYLLSFAIYDTEMNTLKVIFDCDSDWSYTSIGAIKSQIGKTNDVLADNIVRRIFNRR